MSDESTKIPDIAFASKTNPLLDMLPEFVKDPRNYLKIQKALLETLSCSKSHSDALEMAKCKKCTVNMQTRRALMKKFGFINAAQYMAWRRAHEFIKQRMPLDMYNRILEKK